MKPTKEQIDAAVFVASHYIHLDLPDWFPPAIRVLCSAIHELRAELAAEQAREDTRRDHVRDRLLTVLVNTSREPTPGAITGALEAISIWSRQAPRDLLPLLEELASVEQHGEVSR